MTVLFVGPLPPPVHGFSAMNAAMLHLLQARTEVICFDRAPVQSGTQGRPSLRWRSLARASGQLLRFARACVGKRSRTLYLALSGGAGQWMDLLYCSLAAAFGLKIFIHHHSFAYLNVKRASAAALFRLADEGQHIALCPCMGGLLARRYGIAHSRVHVMSNLALLSPPNVAPASWMPAHGQKHPPVQLGFLSNITAEKGIFEFFDALSELEANGIPYEATIAGPVDPVIADRFAATLARLPRARHLGPVYGTAKWQFLYAIDLLLFPTRYVNEAEPVTLLETMQAGAQVVAIDKGCIGGMVSTEAGVAVVAADFNNAVLARVAHIAQLDMPARRQARQKVQAALDTSVAAAQAKRRALLYEMGLDEP